MARPPLIRGKKGQLTGESKGRQLMNYLLSWVTGAGGLEAPISLRYLFTGDISIVARLRRDAQLEKSQRHRLEADLRTFTHLLSLFQHTDQQETKDAIAAQLSAEVKTFVTDYKQDLLYLADIAKQDASLIGELAAYDKGLTHFLTEIKFLGFPEQEAAQLTSKVGELSEKFRQDAKRILVTAQSEYRETASIGQFSYRTSDTLDNIVRRVGRLINNIHNQILRQLDELDQSKKRADVGQTKLHALEAIRLMIAELGLIKTVIEDDQVLISRASRIGQEFVKKAQNTARYVPPKQRTEINAYLQDLIFFQKKILAGLRQTSQQLVFEEQGLENAA